MTMPLGAADTGMQKTIYVGRIKAASKKIENGL